MNQVSRIESIAITILYRYYKNCKIDFSSLDFCDFIVSDSISDFRFAVSIKRTTYAETESYILSIEDILSYNNINEKYRIPYAIMCVNEAKETAKMGVVVSWYNQIPIVNQKLSLKELSDNNWTLIYNQLLTTDKTIRIIPNISWKVIKKIPIIKDDNNWGEVLYLRDLSSNYKMSPKVRTEQEKWDNFFNKGVPQDEFPQDKLDDLILSKIREFSPESNVYSSLLLFNTELRDMQIRYKNYIRHSVPLIIKPNWDELFLKNAQEFNKQITVKLEIFVSPIDSAKVNLLPYPFEKNIDVRDWVQDYFAYSQAITTIHSLKDVIDL